MRKKKNYLKKVKWMKINFVDLKRQYESIKPEIDSAIKDVIDNTAFIMGPRLKSFEENFAKFCGAKHCVGLDNGTTALSLSIKALGIKPGDEVITVPNTFIATTLAISDAGAKIRFVDCDKDTYNMDPEKLRKAISEKTRLILPVHLYGQSCDMGEIMEIADEKGVPVVEDTCQSHGADFKGKKAGTFGKTGCFSFYPGKNLGAYGDGGAIVTDDEEIKEKIDMMRDYGQKQKYHHLIKGHNHRLDTLQAAILNVKLKHLSDWNDMREKNARIYTKMLSGCDGVITPVEHGNGKHIYHLYVVRVAAKKRDALLKHLADNQIYAGIHYPIPIHLQEAYSEYAGEKGRYPVTEKYADEILSLPMFPELTREEIENVCECVQEFLKR